MTETQSNTVSSFPIGMVIRWRCFYPDIVGFVVGENASGIFVRDHNDDGVLVLRFLPWNERSGFEQVHGFEGAEGLLEAKLRRHQVEVRHLGRLLASCDEKIIPLVLDAAGEKLDKGDAEALKAGILRMDDEQFAEFVRAGRHDWLVMLAVQSATNRSLLSALATGNFRKIPSRKYVKLAKRRLQQLA